MNIRDLQYLVALAEHKHFSKAAEACFVSQPTLSTQIKKLEDELGVVLFERAPRQVMITPIGEAIVARARTVLHDVAQIKRLARQSLNPETGTLTLGVFPTLAPYLLPHLVPALQASHPDLELLLVEEKTNKLIELMRQGSIDTALLALPLLDDDMHATQLFTEPFMAATPKNHPLARKKKLKLDDLNNLPLLLLEEGHCLRDQALDVCHMAGTSEREGFRATSLETLRQMVAAGVGITLLPQLAVTAPVPQSPNIRLIPFQSPQPHRQIALVWRASSAMSGFLQQLSDTIKQHLGDLPVVVDS